MCATILLRILHVQLYTHATVSHLDTYLTCRYIPEITYQASGFIAWALAPQHFASEYGTVFARIVGWWIPASYLATVRGRGGAALKGGPRGPLTSPGGKTRSRSRNYKK